MPWAGLSKIGWSPGNHMPSRITPDLIWRSKNTQRRPYRFRFREQRVWLLRAFLGVRRHCVLRRSQGKQMRGRQVILCKRKRYPGLQPGALPNPVYFSALWTILRVQAPFLTLMPGNFILCRGLKGSQILTVSHFCGITGFVNDYWSFWSGGQKSKWIKTNSSLKK